MEHQVDRMKEGEPELPEWLNPGLPVAVIESHVGVDKVTRTKVERITKTQIVTTKGDKFRKVRGPGNSYLMVGHKEYGPVRYLVAPDNTRVDRIEREQRLRRSVTNVRALAGDLPRRPSVEEVDSVIAAATVLKMLLERHPE